MLLPTLHIRAAVALNKGILYPARCFGQTVLHAKQLPPRPNISEADLEESFLKGSGPGGQKINKTSSAVQLKHLPTGTVVKSQATRSRTQNRSIARKLLAEKLELNEKGAESRVALKIDMKAKKKADKRKKAKRKYGKPESNEDNSKVSKDGEAIEEEDDPNGLSLKQ